MRVQPTVRGRGRGGGGGRRVQIQLGLGGGGIWLRGRWFHCDSPCCHQTDGGPWVALSIPTWEACKWRGRAVIIYSPQLLTLDSELITAEGKSDRTWRVPEPVTLISVRCLQQEVWEEELVLSALAVDLRVRVCTHLCVFQPGGGSSGGGRWGWGGGHTAEWLNHDSRWHMVCPLMDQNTAGICAIITVHFAGSSAEKIFMS